MRSANYKAILYVFFSAFLLGKNTSAYILDLCASKMIDHVSQSLDQHLSSLVILLGKSRSKKRLKLSTLCHGCSGKMTYIYSSLNLPALQN